jgi:lycopene cyclase domain-containing protein
MLGTILFPLVLSFDKKVHFYKRWKFLAPAIVIPAIIFIIWDILFTKNGIWHFSIEYTIGFPFLHLPVEEWLFFLFVPYACIFVYDVIKYYWPNFNYPNAAKWITAILILISLALIINFNDRIYTFIVSVMLVIILIPQLFNPLAKNFLFRFYAAYLVCLLPFLIVNGILTSLPVVSYNNIENMHLRILTIPVEDLMYFMTLFLMNISIYEYLINNNRSISLKNK